ncbi:hypothetical protein QUB63_34275 [Microcoleus sp. ARI1-B5]|uniref:hypothetical protein n=1 Tax=unclassified Microcoleus TaxID=2642155 RepID=UPI002FD3D48D
MCEPIFNKDGYPIYHEDAEYGGIFWLQEYCPDCFDDNYTDADYYAYHDADGKLLDKEEH